MSCMLSYPGMLRPHYDSIFLLPQASLAMQSRSPSLSSWHTLGQSPSRFLIWIEYAEGFAEHHLDEQAECGTAQPLKASSSAHGLCGLIGHMGATRAPPWNFLQILFGQTMVLQVFRASSRGNGGPHRPHLHPHRHA